MRNKLNKKRQEEALNICEKLLKKVGVKLDIAGILSKSRIKELNFQRALIVFILKSKGYTFTEIGPFMRRDHATAINLHWYLSKKQGRDNRYKKIKKLLLIDIAENDLKEKIKYHEAELEKLYKQQIVPANQTDLNHFKIKWNTATTEQR